MPGSYGTAEAGPDTIPPKHRSRYGTSPADVSKHTSARDASRAGLERAIKVVVL